MATREPVQPESMPAPASQRRYGGFADLFKADAAWRFGGFALPGGSFWEYREPNAIVIVQAGRLRCSAESTHTRNDRVQILDNAKQMYFSQERFAVPADGAISSMSTSPPVASVLPRGISTTASSRTTCSTSRPAGRSTFSSATTRSPPYTRGCRFRASRCRIPAPRYFALFKELDIETAPGPTT